MRYEDTSNSVSNSATPEARNDADALPTGSNGPATGNVITGAGTITGVAGADGAPNGHVVEIRGAGGTDTAEKGHSSMHVDGRFGALVIDEHGNYKYVADGHAPEDFRDLFQYTLVDAKGGRSTADLMITRGAELKVADNAQRVVPGPDGVVTLPAGVDLNDVHVLGRDLIVTLPDGSQIVIVDGAVFVPQLVLGGVEVPSTNLASLLVQSELNTGAGPTQSSGGNFDVPVPPLDPGVPLGDLIPPTELVFTPPEIKEIGQFIDKHPDAGTVSVQLDDDDVPGKNGNPGGVGDDQGAPNATTSGNLPGSGGDGALTWDLSDGGAPAGFTYVDGPNGSILVQQVQGGNPVTVLTITIDAATGAYTVTENAPILHAAGDNENNASFTILYTVTDADGDTAVGSLNINVDDDTPTVSVTAGSDAEVSLTTHDAATVGANSEAVSTSANFGGVFSGSTSSPGADGAGVGGSSGYALSTTGGASGLFSHGVAINLYNVGGVIVGSTSATAPATATDASVVFSVSTDNNGTVTLTQYQQIDHTADPSPTGAPFTDDIMSLTDGSITLTRSVTVVDKDGDSVTGSASVGIGANLHFVDDGPSIGQADHGEPTLVVDETDLSHNDTQSFAANFSASFGADGPAANSITYALGISAPGADSGLIDVASGEHIFLVLNNGVVEGHVGSTGGALAFTVSVNAAGDVTLDQILALQHPDANNPDTDETVTLSADNLVTLTATAHDFDGDTASSTINIGTNLVFHDDGPTAAVGTTGQTVSLDETVGVQGDSNDVAGPLAQFAGVANKGVDPDMATQFAANANAVVNSTGTVFGADGGTATFSLDVSSAGVDSGLNTTDGHDILLTLENGIVVGRVSGGADDGKAAFAISIDSSGHISMVEWLSIQHPNTGSADESVSIANGAVLAVVTATDNDGDSSTASTAIGGLISFQDDGPTAAIGTTGQTVSLDETPGVQGDSNDVAGPLAQFAGVTNKGVDPDMATQFAANANAIVNSTGTLLGSDGAGSAVFSLNVSSAGVDSGLNTTDGHDILLTLENGIVVGRVSGGADDGKAAFAISIDSSGHVSMVEWLSIQHPNTGNPDDSVSIANGAVLAVVTATDGDGDTSTASTAIGGLLSFQDDGPTAAVGTTGQTVSLDETVGVQGDSNDVAGPLAQFAGVTNKGVDPDMATQFAANANAVINSTGTLFGADGAGTAVFSLNVSSAGVDSGLNTTDGHDILLTLENGIVVGRVSGGADDGKAAFAISVDSSGHISMVEWLSIQHPNTGNPDDSLTIANGAVLAVVTATDGDGDTSTASTAIGGLLSFQDDGPSIDVTKGADAGVLVQTQDHDTIGVATDTASSSANFGGVFGLTSAGGSDGAANTPSLAYTLGVPGAGATGVDSGLDQTGANIYLYTIGGAVVGSTSATLAGVTGGNTVFNVTVSGTGVVTLTQFSQIDHPIAADPTPTGTPFADQLISMADGLITLTASASITDGDGDTATDSETVNIGANLQFADDGPVAVSDSDTVPSGGNTASGNVITGVGTDGGAATADNVGADTPGHITALQGAGGTDTTFSGGVLSIHGSFGTLDIDANGNYTYTRDPGSPGTVQDVFTYTLTDADGDTTTANLTINISDAAPNPPAPVTVLLDDDALAGGNAGGPGDRSPDTQNTTGTLVATGGDGDLDYFIAASQSLPTGFTSSVNTVAGVQTLSISQNGTLVITVALNNETGDYTVTQVAPIMHAADGNTEGEVPLGNILSAINVNVFAQDADGDQSGNAIISISVDDDTPTINVTQSSDAGVNLTTHDALTIGAATDTASSSANFGGIFGLTQSAGADGTNAAATLAYTLGVSAPGVDSGLDQGGANIFLYVIAGKVVGSTSATVGGVNAGNTVFDVGVSGTGVVTLTQYSQIDHPIGSDPTPTGTPFADHIVSMVDSLVTLTASATLTDKDGDTVSDSETVNIGANLHFTDDGPTAAIGTSGTGVSVDESAGLQVDSNDVAGPLAQFAAVANKGVDPDMATQFAANANATVNSTGTVFGADGPGAAVFSLNVSSAGVDSGLNTTDGHDILLFKEGNLIVGRVSGGTDDGKAAFAISIDSTGHLSMVEWLSINHTDAANPDDSVSIANGAVIAVVTATDADGDTSTASTAIGNLISFQDSGPILTAVDNINIQNSGDVAATGGFHYLLGADGALASNDVLAVTGSATVNGTAVTNYVINETSENATTAVYTFSFDYANGTGTTAHETGTLTFDKAAGTYTVDLADPIAGFSVLATAGAPASAFINYNPDGTTSQGPSNIATVQLANNFFMQFTGDSAGSHTTVAPDGTFVPVTTATFANLETFTGSAATVTVSSVAAGVAGNTIQGGEVLDFNLYSTDPHGTTGGTPTTNATSMFIELDGVGSTEDMIVVLKLYDTVTHQYTTVALMVQNGDIITSNATLAGTAYAGIVLDNNDGLIVIEANDYQNGNTNLVIVGAQIAGSDSGVTGTAENFNGTLGASGGWDSTTQAFSTDVSDQPFKIQNIGFLTTTTTNQNADLTFNVTVKDGDLDAVSQTIHATVTSAVDGTTPISLSAAVTTVAPVVLDLNGDGVHFLTSDAGVHYDYGSGSVATAWASPQDGILVNDANHNGTVDNASEFVFGSGGVTDLQALAAFDSNGDGQLSSADANFANFAVWQDANSNGVVDAGEMQSLTAQGIASISLSTDGISYTAAGGDVQVAGTGTYTNADGSTGSLADAAFVTGTRTVEQDLRTSSALSTNTALIGALAAAGLAASDALAAASDHAGFSVGGNHGLDTAGLHTQAFAPVAVDALNGHHASNDLLPAASGGAAPALAQSAASHASEAGTAHGLSVANDAPSSHAPTELLDGTQSAAHNVAPAVAAASIVMPAAAQLAALANGSVGAAQHNQVVGQVLADALHGGGGEATIDSALAALPGHGGANAALEALASHGAAAVPNGDSGVFAGFTAAPMMLHMEALAMHADAAPAHA